MNEAKKVTIFHRVKPMDGSSFYAFVKLVSESGEIFDSFEYEYRKAHIMYASYKVLQRGIRFANDHDYGLISVDTNVPQLAEELSGKQNVNSTLYNQTMERLYGAKIISVEVTE